jgi:hypothetical protein
MRQEQKGQGAKLERIKPDAPDCAQQHLVQRARGAYIASICQPEAAYDLFTAAQAHRPDQDDHVRLNKRLAWQMQNPRSRVCLQAP